VGFRIEGVNGGSDVQLTYAKAFTVMGGTFPNIEFLVAAPQLNEEADGLLAENFLVATDAEFDFANGMIRLFQPVGCENSELAYWDQDRPFAVADLSPLALKSNQIRGLVVVNGVALHAEFDTGAERSTLSLRAARQAGVDVDGPGVRSGGPVGGVGRGHAIQTWIVPVASFKVGDEEVKRTELRVGDYDIEGVDMLLGADFFLSHRVMVASSQAKLYMTYNGGPVFNLENTSQESTSKPPPTQAAGAPGDTLKDADAYGRRGAAFMSRHQYDDAVADFTRAAAMEPTSPEPLIARGKAYVAKDQPAPALADFTAALKLKPDQVEARMLRGELLLKQNDVAGAKADFDGAIKLDPNQRWHAAFAYQKADRFAEAVGEIDAWIDANPKGEDLVQWLNARCSTRALWGQQLDKAEADCDAALRLDPNDAAILHSRGLVRLRRGELDPSIADYNGALRQLPKDAWSLYGRGVARLRKGLKAEGDADIAAAAAADPEIVARAKKLGIAP
jgi:tetratricopeptide (TPR) repeat protein